MKFKCLVCGNSFEEDKNKKINEIKCPKCKENKVSILKTDNKGSFPQFVDGATTILGEGIAKLLYFTNNLVSSFLFTFGNEIKNVLISFLLLLLIFWYKTVFVLEPFNIVAIVVLGSYFIAKLKII